MAWPPSTHGDAEDAISVLRGMYEPVASTWITAGGTTNGVAAATVGTVHFMPMFLPAGTVSDVAVRVSTAATAASGGTVQIGIYATSTTLNATHGRVPDTLLATGTAISTDSTGVKSLVVNQAITGGLYWLALLPLVAAASFNTVTGDSLTGRVGISSTTAFTTQIPTLTLTGRTSLASEPGAGFGASSTGLRSWCLMSSITF